MRTTALTVFAVAWLGSRGLLAQSLLVEDPNIKLAAAPDGPAVALTLLGEPTADPYHEGLVREFAADGKSVRLCFPGDAVDVCGWAPLHLFSLRTSDTVDAYLEAEGDVVVGAVLLGTRVRLKEHRASRYLVETSEHYTFWLPESALSTTAYTPDVSLTAKTGNPRYALHAHAKIYIDAAHQRELPLRPDTYLRVERQEGKFSFVHALNCLSTVRLDGWVATASLRRLCRDSETCDPGYLCEGEEETRRVASVAAPAGLAERTVKVASALYAKPGQHEIGQANPGVRLAVGKSEGDFSEVHTLGRVYVHAWIRTADIESPPAP